MMEQKDDPGLEAMDDFDLEEYSDILFYCILIDPESGVDIDIQIDFCMLLFIHPSISAKQAWEYLNTDFNNLPHKELMKKWEEEIDTILMNTDTFRKIESLEKKMAKKVIEWTRQFLLPKPMDIEQLALSLNLSEESLYKYISLHYLSGEFTTVEILKYLKKFELVLSGKIIDALLDQYNCMKQGATLITVPDI
jgi:hypothetical protein